MDGRPFSGIVFLLLTIRFGLDRVLMDTTISMGSANFTLGILFNFAFVFIAFCLLGYTLFSNRAMQSDAALPLALWLPFLISLFGSVLYTGYPVDGVKFFWNVLTFFCVLRSAIIIVVIFRSSAYPRSSSWRVSSRSSFPFSITPLMVSTNA